jgi:hypothetical protein
MISILKKISKYLKWTRASYTLLSIFLALVLLIMYVWWPLVVAYVSTFNPKIPIWRQLDWLLIGNFILMSLLIMAHADIKADLPIFLIGLIGGLVIEGWGTQTELWVYYTNERPPFWIIPAWPIASLSIDRLFRSLRDLTLDLPDKLFKVSHWVIMPSFFTLMLYFVWPTIGKSLTIIALFFCAFLILTTKDYRASVLTFLAGASLGYFLELWGTTRFCWMYYTHAQPPFFAVLAHGMAAVAFLRVLDLYLIFKPRLRSVIRGEGDRREKKVAAAD